MQNRKRMTALLLAVVMACAGCGGGGNPQNDTSDRGTEIVGDATDSTADAESEAGESKKESQEQEWENVLYHDSDLFIAVEKLELDDEKGEGTVSLHLENERENGAIGIEISSFNVDGKSVEALTDDGAFELAPGQSRDVVARFSNPNETRKLSEAGAIEIEMLPEGLDMWENGVCFFVKGDPDSIIRDTPNKNIDCTVEEAVVYDDHNITITVLGILPEEEWTPLKLRYEYKGEYHISVETVEQYLDDVLIYPLSDSRFGSMPLEAGDVYEQEDYPLGKEKEGTTAHDELLKKPGKIRLKLRIVEGGEVIDEPDIAIPLVYQE